MLNIIAAIGQNNELGKNDELIWPIKEDLKFFRKITMGHPIIMGRKTFESLPKVLDGRRNIVLTRQNITIPNVEVRSYIRGLVTEFKNKDAFIIGGEMVYKQFLDYAENLYLTEIEDECKEADAHFPYFNREAYEQEIIDENYDDKLDVNYRHILYKRRH